MTDMPTIFNRSYPTARKEHQCCEARCRKPIRAGDKYERNEGLWDGTWGTHKRCLRCARLAEKIEKRYRPEFPDEGPAFGELYFYFKECHEQDTWIASQTSTNTPRKAK